MKRFFTLLTTAAALFSTQGLWAQTDSILSKIDNQVSFMDSDYSAEITIVQSKPNQGSDTKVAALFRRDRDAKYLILILKPEVDKGKGYLKNNDFLWLYDPVSRRFTVTNAKERFQNSNARNSDFTKSSLAEDYKILGTSKAKLGSLDTTVYDLQATSDKVTFPRTKLWVTADNLVRMSQDYSLSGQLLRSVYVPSYQKLGNHSVPNTMTIVDELKFEMVNGKKVNEKTVLTIAKPSTTAVPDIVFTKAYLERNAK